MIIRQLRLPSRNYDEAKQLSLHATFRLTYTVQDVVGNESSIQRQLVLINSPFPEPRMVMHGDRVMYHEVNTSSLIQVLLFTKFQDWNQSILVNI